MRVEKPGLGDSEGPDCSEADYESELAAFRTAFKALKNINYVDTNSIYILGLSIGSVSAPLTMQNENVKGFIVSGGFTKTWLEHMLELERRRLALLDKKPVDITEAMQRKASFSRFMV
jgi:esterase/lipase